MPKYHPVIPEKLTRSFEGLKSIRREIVSDCLKKES